jgi:hypothetical protein
MPLSFRITHGWPAVAALALACAAPSAHAERVSARDKAAIAVLDQRLAAAEKRYNDAMVLVGNSDPKGTQESDAALEDIEDVVDACIKQRGCQVGTYLSAYKRLLKAKADAQGAATDADASDDDAMPLAKIAGNSCKPSARARSHSSHANVAFFGNAESSVRFVPTSASTTSITCPFAHADMKFGGRIRCNFADLASSLPMGTNFGPAGGSSIFA